MKRPWILDYDSANCAIGAAVGIIGERSTFLVLREAFNGVRRFDDMRRRTQAEMDELVEAAGFEKIHQEIDEWGIFSVSIARRLES